MKQAVAKKRVVEDPKSDDVIFVKGARVHNLKNVDVVFPRNKLIVVTGVSGSGKSSLTIDTLYAEGQRRYAESLSAYVRQFLNRMDKPDVDYIKGLAPAIAIEQKVITRTPRSTVGSMTEIYDYLRLLYARIGKTISPVSGREVKKDDVRDVIQRIKSTEIGAKVYILSAFRQHQNRNTREELNILMQKGFSRLYVRKAKSGSEIARIEEFLELGESELKEKFAAGKSKDETSFFILIDRIVVKELDEDDEHRLGDSIGTAFYEGEGDVFMEVEETGGKRYLVNFNNRFELDGIQFEEPSPNLFSFNNPYGACPTCEGFSMVLGIDEDLVIPNKLLSVYEGGVAPWKGEKLGKWKENFIRAARKFDFPVHRPIIDLSPEQYQVLWKGNQFADGIDAFFKEVEQNLYKVQYRVLLSRYRGRTSCPDCEGYRLRKEAFYVKVAGKHIGELGEMPVSDLQQWFRDAVKSFSDFDRTVAKRIIIEIEHRIDTLLNVGLGYLTLSRVANTLSGGESQRIQLTRSLGSNLTNSLYILDEPSIGLHSRDTKNLIRVLKELRDLGNTVVVVEHDEMMMREADYIIDMGPLASHLGGEVVAAGNYDEIISNAKSLTGKYLSGKLTIDPPAKARKWKNSIIVEGARQHNLKDITVEFPLNVLCVVSGVSGSGKTTLVRHILYPALQKLKGEAGEKMGLHKSVHGAVDEVTAVEMVDQNPIGKSSRSNPVTYIQAWNYIRDLFAAQALSKIRGFQAKHFSFNVDAGRCDACKGEGEKVVEMQFLADVHLTCEVCHGKRFREEVLEVQYKGKNVFDVLEMSVDQAVEFFQEEKSLVNAIRPLSDVGLGYVKLGQSSDTLSGGEAQRVKLASFLGKGKGAGKILFIFDEPTTGLHFHDIKKLLLSFNALIEQGHSVLVIEHNTDVIKSADWVIDLGADAGIYGGNLVYAGKPEGLRDCKASYTAQFL
jgi:excinuclease ABC subunit A